MTIEDFRRIALSFQGAEESSHMGAPDFRVGGRIFATLASQDQGFGNLMLTPAEQGAFVTELPEIFLPVAGGWGRKGITHIRLAEATEDVLTGALRTAWQLGSTRTVAERRKGLLTAEPLAAGKIVATRPRPITRPPNAVRTKAIPETGHQGESRARRHYRRRSDVNRCWSDISIRCERHSYADSY